MANEESHSQALSAAVRDLANMTPRTIAEAARKVQALAAVVHAEQSGRRVTIVAPAIPTDPDALAAVLRSIATRRALPATATAIAATTDSGEQAGAAPPEQ
jgi:hypothetical protein